MGKKRRKARKVPQFVKADDLKESLGFLLKLRLPWLVAGLVGGFGASILISRFESFLEQNVSLAFFIPFIVYLSDALGTQTETIYVRNITNKKSMFHIYLVKESLLGLIFGMIFGIATILFSYIWLRDFWLSLSVGLALAISLAIAPFVALVTTRLFQIEHQDPAVGAGPFKTILQDIVSILIYFGVSSVILFS